MARLKQSAPRLGQSATRLRRAPSPTSEAERLAERNRIRPNWYGTARWQKLRWAALVRDGFVCRQTGVALLGTYPASDSPAVDHIDPHHWDPVLFWDIENLQSVTKAWHDGEKQRREKGAAG
ncbi:hypothetical protein LX81_00270 [Palleronia aestuarii]|uniref:HNH endonuclease n=1 Tax=Palleronia aestuarii TaxID=568105 RepID=A0A2W7NNU1_9RHOB|nr:HNH endonuclease [Palleronia aestuarii]PZX19807.1 hypothetical protein LX81_00270 [Palleronia aestuarii]